MCFEIFCQDLIVGVHHQLKVYIFCEICKWVDCFDFSWTLSSDSHTLSLLIALCTFFQRPNFNLKWPKVWPHFLHPNLRYLKDLVLSVE